MYIFAYLAIAWCSLRPFHVDEETLPNFAQRSVQFLTNAESKDIAKFLDELVTNIRTILDICHRKTNQKRSRYQYIFEKDQEIYSFAGSFLRVCADARICRILIQQDPWRAALLIEDIARYPVRRKEVEPFLQQICSQSILDDEGILEREKDIHGFGAAPVFSQRIFENVNILERYRIFSNLQYMYGEQSQPNVVDRLNFAAELCLRTMLERKRFNSFGYHHDVLQSYENLFMRARGRRRSERSRDKYDDLRPDVYIESAVEVCRRTLAELDASELESLYVSCEEQYDDTGVSHNIFDQISDLVLAFWEIMSKDFRSYEDPDWGLAITLWQSVFGGGRKEIGHLDPLQQRIAIKLRRRIRKNMVGLPPRVARTIIPILCINQRSGKDRRDGLEEVLAAALAQFCHLWDEDKPEARMYLAKHVDFDRSAQSFKLTMRHGEIKEFDVWGTVGDTIDLSVNIGVKENF